MTRTSLVEQYNNRDVVAQIYRLISLVESSTITSVETERMGDTVTLVLHMFDGTVQRFQFEADGIRNITAVQNGSIETVNILMDSGRTYSFTFNIAIAGMTTDTAQNVTATKTFTAPQVFRGGITGPLQVNGTTVIDGEVQVSNGHSLAVAGDVECANAVNSESVNSESAEIGNLAIEPNGTRTVLSNEAGITITGTTTVNVPTNNPGIRDTKAVNGTRVENSLDAYTPMVRNTGNQTINGFKTFNNVIIHNGITPYKTVVQEATSDALGKFRLLFKYPLTVLESSRPRGLIIEGVMSRVNSLSKVLFYVMFDSTFSSVGMGGTWVLKPQSVTPNDTFHAIVNNETGYLEIYAKIGNRMQYAYNRFNIVSTLEYASVINTLSTIEIGDITNLDELPEHTVSAEWGP